MKFLRCFIAAVIFIITNSMMAQSQKELSQLMRNRGEYYFTLSVNNPTEIQSISEICSVDGTDGHTVVAYANQKEYDRLLKAGYQPKLQTPPSIKANGTMWDGQGTYNWDAYLTYDQYVAMMESFPAMAEAMNDGRTCTLFSLGTLSTSNHRQLLGVRINNGSPEGKPKFLYTSTMHGDEITGMILMLRLIDELCTSTDSQIVNLVNNLDIYIMPLTNPDGTYNGGNNTVSNAKRYNGHNIDLNRNYKDYFMGNHPDNEAYEDETIWTMAFADSLLFTMGGNYHGGAEVMNYPWDPVYTDHADKDWYEYTCTRYVQVARKANSSYMTDTYSDGVTNGATWYTISGSRQDYMNAYAQCREVTVECSTAKTPTASQLPNFWNYNHYAMLAFMEEALHGVHGFVYDAVSGEALQGVMVTVENHDINNSYVTTHSIGDFHRPIKGGTYTFTFSKQGYYPQSVQVTVADGERVELNNIQLQPNLNLTADFTASNTNVSLGQSIDFTDTSEGMTISWNWTFEGATPSSSTEQNPTSITYNTPGDYDVTLIVTGPNGNIDTLTKNDYIHVAETILMQTGSVTTCSGVFYDSGGPDSNYGNNLNYTMTFYPGTEGAMVCVDFTQFNTESGYDYLYIYNGTSESATQIGKYHGTTSPGTVVASNEAGALTFKFTSDSGVNAAGWAATISCFQTDVPVNITVSANPSNGGSVNGGGEFTFGQTCTVTATPNTGYTFTGWTENGTTVSSELEYNFTAISDRDLVANFIQTVEIGTASSTNSYLPTYNYYNYSYTEQIYTAQEIGTAGTINSIAFYNGGAEKTRTLELYVKSTDKASFSSKTDWVAMETSDMVFTGSVTMAAGAWTFINFNTPFEYDGASNLVIAVDDNTGEYTSSPHMACSVFSTNENQAIYAYNDYTDYNPMSPPTTSTSNNDVLSVKNHIFLGIETAIEQPVTLAQGWNWFVPTVNVTLEQLEEALGSNGTSISTQESGYVTCEDGEWGGTLTELVPGQVYNVQVANDCQFSLSGQPASNVSVTIVEGYNWFGYTRQQPIAIEDALYGFTPAEGDAIISFDQGFTNFEDGEWGGNLTQLVPGQGYIYISKDTGPKQISF